MNGSTVPSRQASSSPSRIPAHGRSARRRDDLRELAADVVEVAASTGGPRRPRGGAGRGCRRTCPRPRPSGRGGARISAASSAGRGEHELERVEQRELGARRGGPRGPARGPADVAGEHARPLDGVERPVEGLGDAPPRASPSRSPIRSSPERTLTMPRRGLRVGAARAAPSRSSRLGGRARRRPRSRRTPRRPRASVGESAGSGAWPASRQHVADRRADVGRAVVRRAEGARGRRPPTRATASAIVAQPMPVARWSASGNGRPVRNTTAIGSSSGVEVREVVGEERRLLGGPVVVARRARRARSSAAWRRWYTRAARCSIGRVVPGVISKAIAVVLRRHVPENLRGLPALVPRPRGRPADALPGRADARRRDRALLPAARARPRLADDGASTSATTRPAHRVLRVLASSTATTARRCTTSRSARRTPGATATAPRRRG